MDLRQVRKEFIDKKVAYACSYDPELSLDLRTGVMQPGGVRVRMQASVMGKLDTEPRATIGSGVFHAFDALTVAGVDDRMHDCPLGRITLIEESILFRYHEPIAEVSGRLCITADGARDRETTIFTRYSGILRFDTSPFDVLNSEKPLEGAAWVVPVFETSDTRYRWLSEHACAAFGTWRAEPGKVSWLMPRRVTSQFDVYSLG